MLRFLFRFLIYSIITIAIICVAAFFLIVEDAPTVADKGAPNSEDVQAARKFVRAVRDSARPNVEQTPLVVTVDELNRIIKLGARFVPGFRGEIQVEGDIVIGTVSAPVPFTQESRWVDVRASAPAFQGEFELSEVSLGPLSLPPGLALETARVGGNIVLGNSAGDAIVNAASRMAIDGESMSFDLELAESGKNGIITGVFDSLRGNEMPDASRIQHYYLKIREAMEARELPQYGSYLPYLQFTLALLPPANQMDDPGNEYTAAIFGLTRVCGARDFLLIVGSAGGDDLDAGREWSIDCSNLTLNDRIDSRRHFTTAAALQAASNRGFSVSVGEFKELYDTVKSGGFDFTDIAANNSGIRMSDRIMGASANEWPGLFARVQSERDVIIDYDGIPQILKEDEFIAQFGEVDSPAYLEMIGKIEGKIDGLALHRPF